jgi:hypothetical protein
MAKTKIEQQKGAHNLMELKTMHYNEFDQNNKQTSREFNGIGTAAFTTLV